jgi:diguanylate cyclase (GGDEF)-like protein
MDGFEHPPASNEDRAALKAALDCYLAAISDISAALVSIYPQFGSICRDRLMRLEARLAFDANPKTLEESRQTLHQTLQTFAAQAGQYTRALSDELAGALDLVARNEDSQSARHVVYVERLVDFVEQMESAVHGRDLAKLSGQAQELRQFAESIELDTRDALGLLRAQIRSFQQQLREAELLASRDALTGIANRRELDRQLAARIDSSQPFCVLLFDLNGLGMVNNHHGHLCGDDILKQLSARLAREIRPRDFVCRWGGDEFVVILDCGLLPAQNRSAEIARCLNGEYSVSIDGQPSAIHISVAVGVAEYQAGENREQLFQRVDESMYRQKKSRAAGEPSA